MTEDFRLLGPDGKYRTAGKLGGDLGLDDQPGGSSRRWVIVRHATAWHPPTDVYETDGRLIVIVEIAGMRDSDFNVTLHGQRLTISGVRQRITQADSAFHQLEIAFGEFRTTVSVPWPVQRDAVAATYRDGFLRVELPHAPAHKVQIVDVDEQLADETPDADAGPEATGDDTDHDTNHDTNRVQPGL